MINPLEQLQSRHAEALAANDAMASFAVFSTIDDDGWPMSRTVTLRDLEHKSISISVNGNSPKCRQLQANGRYELLIFWPSVMAQYRLRGDYLLDGVDAASWHSKPERSKLADLYHSNCRAQSSVLPSRQVMLAEASRLQCEDPLLKPATVATLTLIPTEIESWHASLADRLHHRTRHFQTDRGWDSQLLVP